MSTGTEFMSQCTAPNLAEPVPRTSSKPELGEILVFTDNRSEAASILEFAGLGLGDLADEHRPTHIRSHFRHFRRARRDRPSLQREPEASKTEDSHEDARGKTCQESVGYWASAAEARGVATGKSIRTSVLTAPCCRSNLPQF